MKVIADRNLNLHSKPFGTELVHLPKRRWKTIPDEIKDHDPTFQLLVDSGVIVVAKESTPLLAEPEDEVEDDKEVPLEDEEEVEEDDKDKDEDEE